MGAGGGAVAGGGGGVGPAGWIGAGAQAVCGAAKVGGGDVGVVDIAHLRFPVESREHVRGHRVAGKAVREDDAVGGAQ